MTAAASRTLRDKAEADRCEVMIEREGNPDSDAFHDREARRIDLGKLVQVRAAKIIPRLFQVANSHGRTLTAPGLPTAFFHVSATSRFALRSRNVKVSMTTGTEV